MKWPWPILKYIVALQKGKSEQRAFGLVFSPGTAMIIIDDEVICGRK
jgi:hypothetical protein